MLSRVQTFAGGQEFPDLDDQELWIGINARRAAELRRPTSQVPIVPKRIRRQSTAPRAGLTHNGFVCR